MRSRKRVIEAVRERVATQLVEAMERGVRGWPLPSPPLIDIEFPPVHPSDAKGLVEQAHGFFMADRGGFERYLNETVELVVPHRMSLTEDPFEQHEKWLLRRLDMVSERILFSTCTSWLAQALDEQMPDTTRWWLAFALLDGLSVAQHGQPVHQGYHLLESIALAQRPGTWHSQPEAGPHMIGWNPQAVMPRTEIFAHDDGCASACELLRRLEDGEEERRLLLVEWMKLLLERKELFGPLGLAEIILRRTSDPSPKVAAEVARCLARLVDIDSETGRETLSRLFTRKESEVQRALADILTRMFRRIGWDAVEYLEKMLESDDENVLAAASATVGDLRFLDEDKFSDTLLRLCSHPLPIVRRNIVPHLREYIRINPDDERGLLTTMWVDGDEVVATRLRELLMRLEEVDPTSFSKYLHRLEKSSSDALNRLFTVLEIRKPETAAAWKTHLTDGTPPPAVTPPPDERKPVISNMEMELPDLGDALSILDGEE